MDGVGGQGRGEGGGRIVAIANRLDTVGLSEGGKGREGGAHLFPMLLLPRHTRCAAKSAFFILHVQYSIYDTSIYYTPSSVRYRWTNLATR